MAQITETLIEEQFARHNRGEHLNLTINEEAELLLAWRENRRYQMIAWLRLNSRNEHLIKQVMIKYGFGQYGSEMDTWEWNQDKAEMQPLAIISKIYEEARKAVLFNKPQLTTEGSNQNDSGNSSGS